ncbi:hypothetical protein TraAM80_07966 [Trypanosoma rangeli]|uniref:Uncharacterized protein n=1 Tax=Trypanosoma rangeli TaxID=5698 RepID=A0A422N2Y8_TRYRA|nr:uncharacterized protein TraAM80_07966 [Trypanosoma rangeli]RNE99846.1 hypothetical protein TraAM80_07966 [Trypanosoma rangeli]|eukprot:RNE99846.1 hypothetical protein TraAM80_07966 [Trypanosoma rangeli]
MRSRSQLFTAQGVVWLGSLCVQRASPTRREGPLQDLKDKLNSGGSLVLNSSGTKRHKSLPSAVPHADVFLRSSLQKIGFYGIALCEVESTGARLNELVGVLSGWCGIYGYALPPQVGSPNTLGERAPTRGFEGGHERWNEHPPKGSAAGWASAVAETVAAAGEDGAFCMCVRRGVCGGWASSVGHCQPRERGLILFGAACARTAGGGVPPHFCLWCEVLLVWDGNEGTDARCAKSGTSDEKEYKIFYSPALCLTACFSVLFCFDFGVVVFGFWWRGTSATSSWHGTVMSRASRSGRDARVACPRRSL